ncbi:Vegetative incompatibility protein HET-E-1, partial [Colletotrichum gloeosporioides]
MADDAQDDVKERRRQRQRRGLLPPELVDLMGPPLKVGALTGSIGLFSGIAAGIIRDSTPALFAIASGIQWFALGSSYWLSRSVALNYLGREGQLSDSSKVKASAVAGGTAGMVGGLIRGPKNIIPGIIVFSIVGGAGQAIVNRTQRVSPDAKEKKSFFESSWSPLKKLSDDEYRDMLDEKMLKIDAEIALIDDKIAELRAAKAAEPPQAPEPPSKPSTTLRLQDFSDLERPKYAILSHTWGKEEVSLQERMEWEEGDPNQKTRIEAKSGFKKIANACRIARLDGHPYIWVDTNCIDKKSSAELSEAINSMFSWYQASRVCFAYLEDLPAETTTKDLSRCRWFTRGWTLQELLAPRRVTFFDSAWESVGTKTTLRTRIREATCIEAAVLRDPAKINTACAAKKMSWASSRQTTRVEDMAYCLLGLFNINMPLLYGEGNDAFRRLQEEIIKVSTDQSLFAWDWPSTTPKYYLRGLHSVTTLAPFPSAFGKCHDVVRDLDHELQTQPRHREYAMTNFGLNIALPLLIEKQGARYGALNCRYKKLQDFLICIPLSIHDLTGTFYRDDSRDLIIIPRRYFLGQPTSILLPRYSESQHYALSPSFLRPQDGEVSFLLFTSNRDLGLWEIRTSWGYMRA